jgi:hypothetical protein
VALYINWALPFFGKFDDGDPCIYNSKTYPTPHGKQASKHGGKEYQNLDLRGNVPLVVGFTQNIIMN